MQLGPVRDARLALVILRFASPQGLPGGNSAMATRRWRSRAPRSPPPVGGKVPHAQAARRIPETRAADAGGARTPTPARHGASTFPDHQTSECEQEKPSVPLSQPMEMLVAGLADRPTAAGWPDAAP